MDQNVIDFINERMNRLEVKSDRVEDKVDQILAFKWQIVGMSATISGFLTLAISIAAIIYSKGG